MSDVVPMLSYENGAAAMDWLIEAFGFVEVERWLDDEGGLAHGELRVGDGRIFLATPNKSYQNPLRHREECATAAVWQQDPWVIDGVFVAVDAIEEHYARALAAGATMLSPIEESVPGLIYRVEDIEGHRWMFAQKPQ